MSDRRHSSSFRDPSGFLFERDDALLRQVNVGYADDYRALIDSGLYAALVERGWLVEHDEVDEPPADPAVAWRVIRPRRLPFVSHPYEWCFGQLRDAALLTLDVQRLALVHGMVLKDASAYNVQFAGSRPLFIDTLSFARYEEGRPWVAYRQFCQHFLAPLALAAHRDVRLAALSARHLDGIPLDLAASLLPKGTWRRFGLLTHLVLHARSQRRHAHGGASRRDYSVSRLALEGLVDSLRKTVEQLRWRHPDTEWGDYYADTNYDDGAVVDKRAAVERFVDAVAPRQLWDLGANTGRFSRIASSREIFTVAFDVDPVAVERNYARARHDDDGHLLPLLLDLTNPSPALGWAHAERASLRDRGPADAATALALVHHLAIGNNVPLPQVAGFLAELADELLVEWVPKRDSQVERLLRSREDVFAGYHREGFEAAFGEQLELRSRTPVEGSQRWLYHYGRRG